MTEKFSHAQLFQRHGAFIYGRFCVARLLRKTIGVELCEVATSNNDADYPEVSGYRMCCLHIDFPVQPGDPAKSSIDEFSAEHAKILARGHFAVITLDRTNQQIVGHNFYARSATQVVDGVLFEPGGDFFYSYGAQTHSKHRGRRLSPARWTWFREWRLANGFQPAVIFYVALDNLASLASGTDFGRTVLGYSAWRQGKKNWCYRSPGSKREGVGFFLSTSDTTLTRLDAL